MDEMTINILCATDKNFVPYCGIMLTSLFENNKEEHFGVYIIVDESVTPANRNLFLKLGEHYSQKIELVPVDESSFAPYPVYNKQWTNSIYYRLLAAELLPKTIDKLIYLDCDIIVNGAIREMWEIDVTDNAVGCVPDTWAYRNDIYERLSLKNDGKYFNSGVLLINLNYWRGKQLGEQYLTYIKENFERLWFNDQDTLNGVLFDQKKILPLQFNFQVCYLEKRLFNNLSQEIRDEVISTTNPLIIHYSASDKPWSIIYYKMPYLELWRKYRDMSLWQNIPNILPKSKKLNWIIKRYLFWPCNIMPKENYIRLE